MSFPLFTGCATALITPFLPDGRLDEPALRRLLAMQTAAKMDALVLLGTTGEPWTRPEYRPCSRSCTRRAR